MKQQLTKGVMWLSAAKLAVNVLALSSTFVMARILMPDDFGIVAIATAMLEVLMAFTQLSLAASLIHHENPTDDHFHTAWTMNLIRATLLGIGFAVASPWVASAYGDPRLVSVMCWIGFSVFLGGLSNPKVVTLTRQLIFKQEFLVLVVQKVAGVVVGIAFALIFRTYWALIAGIVATQIAGIVASYVVVRYRPRISLRHARELLSFSVWLALGQIVNTLNWRLDHLLIGARIGTDALGLYTVGDKLASLPTRETIGPIEQALFPGLRTVADDPVRLKAAYRRTQAVITAVALPLGVLFALQADLLVRMVLGDKWSGAVIVVQYLASVFALQTMASAVRPLALAKGETRLLFMRDVAGFCMRVPLIGAAALWGGLALVLQARTLTGILAIGLNMTVVRRILGQSLLSQLRNNERSLVSVGVMAACIYWFVPALVWNGQWLWGILHVVGTTALGLVIYGLVHYGFWRVMGRPQGAEVEFVTLLRKLGTKFGKSNP